MGVTFVDRQSTYPNRYKITREDGTTEYVTLERADEPTVVGTPLNAETFNSLFADLGNASSGGSCALLNLLDNSDFTTPVNQRGQTSYSNINDFSIDRWLLGSIYLSLTVNDGYITLANSATDARKNFIQRLGADYTGKSFTMALCDGSGTVYCGSGVMPGNGENSVACFVVPNQCRCALVTGDEGSSVRLEVFASSSIDVKWVTLYEGEYTADTLPPYTPKGRNVELMVSQRDLTVLTSYQYGDTLPDPGVPGRIFFKKVT